MPSATKPESRSPSPTPAPPIADAPGVRAQGLINVFNQAVKASLDKCSPDSFASCFPTTAQYGPEILDDIRRQLVDQLDRTWKANFETVMQQKDVVKSLNALDQSIEDARLRRRRVEASANGGTVDAPVPPHTLSPNTIRLAHLMPFLEEQTTEFNSKLSATQAANSDLLSTVTSQRAEIEALVNGLENVIHDLENSAQMMGQEDVQGLSKEIKELETEMKKRTWSNALPQGL
ncbi:Nnf1-domain-containing protein [Lophiotrema nucula]|uniref:Nnf1-domain-containing protein n=1 Tax=Lophiotrema nucula TaxID=690887 RepID=A0A6A5YT18_9PLEO|nr:Nnf1-domain-containing protein [Lophiotrema nucula]